MKKWLYQPLLHFLVLGGLLYVAQQAWVARQGDTIAVSEAMVQQLREDWRRETGRDPQPQQLQASLNRQIDEERLLREALRLGLDERDAVARRRLIANLRFALGDESLDELHALAEARRLNLASSDIVVRRRLVQVMEQRLLQQRVPPEPELRAYIDRHPQRYAQGARFAFEQRYFTSDGRGMQAALQLAGAALAAPAPAGEPFLLGEQFPLATQDEIATRFGPAFALAVAQAKPGAWTGPVISPYGAHLVRITRSEPGQAADYAAVRMRAAYAWLGENEPRLLREALAPLRARYRVEFSAALAAQGLKP